MFELEKILYYIKKLIPRPIFAIFQPLYHFLMSLTGNIIYRFPGYKMTVIGITGTNGKTTTTELISEILKASGKKVGMISTVNIEIAGTKWENKTNRTTLGRWRTHRIMHHMRKQGCKYAVIEVASEGIAWYRTFGIPFDTAVFMNLSPEHLNFHKNMKNYRNTKGRLFAKLSNPLNTKRTKRISVVNTDDKEADYFLSYKADKQYTFGLNSGDIRAKNIECREKKTEYDIEEGESIYHIKSKLIGEFNVYNALAAFSVGHGYGIDIKKIIKAIEGFKGVKGRTEDIKTDQEFRVVVDYAVTPVAQEMVYRELRKFCKGKLISVFGATGDKDREKRPGMGSVAAGLTDTVILTDDETYNEDRMVIIDEVYSGVPKELKDKVIIIPDRYHAIKKALSLAEKDDTVIITGIGHQKFRVMEGKKISWNEREIVKELLSNIEGK